MRRYFRDFPASNASVTVVGVRHDFVDDDFYCVLRWLRSGDAAVCVVMLPPM